MLALLPLAAFAATFLALFNACPQLDWRRSLLRACVICGAVMILATELLSLVRAVTPVGLAIAWCLPLLVSAVYLRRQHTLGKKILLPGWRLPESWGDRLMLLGVLVILVATAVVAWQAPPHTGDSVNYHLPKVAEWAQNRSVRHFPTGIDVQNSLPPGAEIAVLQFYVLAGSDRLANFVEWLAMLGCLTGVAAIAAQLGARPAGQMMAAVFAATLPAGIAQASSTMNDYVVAFWLVCVASEAVGMLSSPPALPGIAAISTAAGMALVTKPTSVPYLLPFAVLTAAAIYTRLSLRKALGWTLLAILLVFMLNSGYLARNYTLYGNPISGSRGIAQEHANEMMTLPGVLSNLIRNAALHTGTPWKRVNHEMFRLVVGSHVLLHVDPNDDRTTSVGPYREIKMFTQEDLVGNPAHAVLIVACFLAVIVLWKPLGRHLLVYTLAAASTLVVFSVLFKWQIFGARYHLPFFVLFAPAAGYTLVRLLSVHGARAAGLVLMVISLPWLVSIDSRPLIPVAGQSTVGSVLTEPREKLYFANALHLVQPYQAISRTINDASCSSVGLMLSGGAVEYPLWVLLGAPRDDLHIEWIVSGPSSRYETPGFQPCAVICQRCPEEWQTVRDLPVVYDDATFRLYLAPGNSATDP